ncbi:MAG TPA: glycine cleavage system protein H [Terriglobia bacterium]|jgi:glycine cleavage system H lipoate-binding protein|nr:glycine cleavage system protein H [Terriglobia bacterium]
MVAMMVLATFVVFVLVDYYFQVRRAHPAKAVEKEGALGQVPFPLSIVGGFKLPANLSYHPGHTWAMKESRQLVRIGMDDLAVRLLGGIDQLELPARGRWLRQGETGWTLVRGTHRFEMLSPIEGEVVDVNTEVLKDPSLARKDPYGRGWLLAVNAPAADGNLKNLLHSRLAQRWMEESVAELQSRISAQRGAHLQDGGQAVADVLAEVPEDQWDRLVRDTFLT